MNSDGTPNATFTVFRPHLHEHLQLVNGGAASFPPASSDHQEQQVLCQQHATQIQSTQQQSAFHTRVRDIDFTSWGQQQQQQEQPESVWQGHKNPKVFEGEELHCFNSFCPMTFPYNHQLKLVEHIVGGECGEMTEHEISCLVRNWKALQVELSRCGQLTIDEIFDLETAWKYLHEEQQQERRCTRKLIGLLVFAWDILTGNRSNKHDIYFASWGQQQKQLEQPESVWQGHNNPKVYEGDELHCFNNFCLMTFPNNHQLELIAHIVAGECGEITVQEISCLVRDWKALQILLSRYGQLTVDEVSSLETAWKYLHYEQQESRRRGKLIGFLVFAWDILTGNRSTNKL